MLSRNTYPCSRDLELQALHHRPPRVPTELSLPALTPISWLSHFQYLPWSTEVPAPRLSQTTVNQSSIQPLSPRAVWGTTDTFSLEQGGVSAGKRAQPSFASWHQIQPPPGPKSWQETTLEESLADEERRGTRDTLFSLRSEEPCPISLTLILF